MRAQLCVVIALAAGISACAISGADVAAAELSCPFDEGRVYDPDDPYPFCQYEGPSGAERYCRPSLAGWSYMVWHTNVDGTAALCHDRAPGCNTCNCTIGCRPDTPWVWPRPPDGGPGAGASPGSEANSGPCPVPTSGTASATCAVVVASDGVPDPIGFCVLFCEHGETCPDGMHCVLDPPEDGVPTGGHHVCAWAIGNDRCAL